MEVQKAEKYLGSAITLGNVMQMKTNNVKVSISGMPYFNITYDDVGYVDATATYVFDKDCVIALGSMVEVV